MELATFAFFINFYNDINPYLFSTELSSRRQISHQNEWSYHVYMIMVQVLHRIENLDLVQQPE